MVKRKEATKPSSTAPTEANGPTKFVNWDKNPARVIILGDLEAGILPIDETELSTEEAWDTYKRIYEFKNVPFRQFSDRLRDHREQVRFQLEKNLEEELAFAHDRCLHPRRTHNRRGELVFDLTPAKQQLREDVEKGVHEQMTAAELQESNQVYWPFDQEKFRRRIEQEIRRQKFMFYLEKKRNEERAKLLRPEFEAESK
jgi:hypothetical protein